MKKFSLVQIGRATFIMLNAKQPLLNNQCNSDIFEDKKDSVLNTDVFKHFGLSVHIIAENLDRRTKKFKLLENRYEYFSASFLPEIKKHTQSNSIIFRKFKS